VSEEKLKVQTDLKVVESRDLFRMMAKVYSITTKEAQDATLGDAPQYSYSRADAKAGPKPSWEKDYPEDWSKVEHGTVRLSAVLRDLLKRGLVEAGEYIVTHSW
jgi:hypothetical protein